MGFLDRIFERSSYRGASAMDQFNSIVGMPLDTKIPQVSVQSSLTLSPIWTAIKIKAETVASLHLSIYERKGDGAVEAFDHPLWHLLNYEPSTKYNPFTWKETLQSSIDLNGNGFCEIIRKSGTIEELRFHPVENVVLAIPENNKEIFYQVKEGVKTRSLIYDAMIHIPSMAVLDGLFGLSPILQNSKSLALFQTSRDYGTSFYANGGNVSGVLTPTGILTPEQKKNIREEWDNKYSGIANVGKTAILTGGMTYTPISINPMDSGLIESLKYGVEEAARMYRIPLHMMQSLERATNNNIEHQGIEFVVYCILPSIKRWESELNRKLFLNPDSRKKYFVRFNIDSLLRGDSAARAAYYSSLFNIGVLSQNDIRRLENMNPIGPEGDKYYVQLNMGQPVNSNTNTNDTRK